MEKMEINNYFKEELAKRKGTLNLSEDTILDLYLCRCFDQNYPGFYEQLLEAACLKYIDIENTLLESVSGNKKKIKKGFIKAIDENLLDLINYDNCQIRFKTLAERIPANYLDEALKDICSEFKPVLSRIYVIADIICRDAKGKKYSRDAINKILINSYDNYMEVYEDYEDSYIEPKEEKPSKLEGKKLKYSYEPYYTEDEIEDYGDNTEYPTNITNSIRKIR